MGQAFTTDQFSVDDEHVSLYTWHAQRERWELCDIESDALRRLRHVIDCKRQLRTSSDRVYGWGVEDSFVPWKDEISEETIQEMIDGTTPFFRAIYRDDQGNYHNRDKVRVQRLCVSKVHLNEAMSGATPTRSKSRHAAIISACTAWELEQGTEETLSSVNELSEL